MTNLHNSRVKLALFLALTYSNASLANDWIPSDYGATIGYQHASEEDFSAKDLLSLDTETVWEFSERYEVTLGTHSHYDFAKKVDRDSQDSSAITNLYLSFEAWKLNWRIGKQQIAWGVVDGLRILDQISPLNFNEFNLQSTEERMQHQWMLNVEGEVASSSWQLLWSPEPKVHILPDQADLFSFRAPRLRYGAEIGSPSPTIVDESVDAHLVAARWTHFFDQFELTGAVIHGPDHEPIGELSGVGADQKLIRKYEERTLLGASLSADIGTMILRSEFAFSPNKSLNFRDGASLQEDQYKQSKFAIGVEFNAFWDLLFNLQYMNDHIYDADESLVRPETDHIVTFNARRNFMYDALTTELKIISSDHEDGEVQFNAKYELTESIFLDMGFDVFFGDEDTLFGQYDDRDRIRLGTTIHL